MNVYEIILVVVFGVMSIIGFASMGIDKKKAQEGKWRTKEATLFLIAILFGGVGSALGMYIFRHKTKHWYFAVFFPIFAIIDLVAFVVGIYFL